MQVYLLFSTVSVFVLFFFYFFAPLILDMRFYLPVTSTLLFRLLILVMTKINSTLNFERLLKI